jgi:hypothetical protein
MLVFGDGWTCRQSVLAQHSSHCLGYNLKYLVFFWKGIIQEQVYGSVIK